MSESVRVAPLASVSPLELPARDVLAAPTAAVVLALFGTTVFLAAALVFFVQPMIAKTLLPSLGGTPAVWNVCVLFFQGLLVAGYAYTHLVPVRLGARRHAAMHCLLLLPLGLLPAVGLPSLSGRPEAGAPVTWLLLSLTTAVGLPFFAAATSAPLLQCWFASTRHPAARDPYLLYAASNAGSIVALLVYPVLVEPLFGLTEQRRLWALGYSVVVVLVGTCALVAQRGADGREEAGEARSGTPPSMGRRGRWLALAFVPSTLMLAVTRHVSTDIAAVPLLWIVPLALYLLSFVLAFATRELIPYRLACRALPLLAVPLVIVLVTGLTRPFWYVLPLHLGVFFFAALICHTELARDRPSVEHLTGFYVWMAIGGALGGAFNAVVAPVTFSTIAEYPIALVLACFLLPAGRKRSTVRKDVLAAAAVAVLTILALVPTRVSEPNEAILIASLAVPALACFSFSRQPVRFGLGVGAMFLVASLLPWGADRLLYVERTFFGVYRVTEEAGRFRTLLHGTTVHGRQRVGEEEDEPLSYYHRSGPIGQVFAAEGSRLSEARIGAVGLGTGSLTAFATAGQDWTFFEIDPAVIRIAGNPRYFTYLSHAAVRPTIVVGDARRSLEREADARFDLLVLDAFSSDAIPVHLLTLEAVDLYLAKLRPEGLLAFHVSNRHLRLEPILARIGDTLGLAGISQIDRVTESGADAGRASSHWVVLARSEGHLRRLSEDGRWRRLTLVPDAPLWTDEFSNLLSVLSPR